jgi:hypothetical protein
MKRRLIKEIPCSVEPDAIGDDGTLVESDMPPMWGVDAVDGMRIEHGTNVVYPNGKRWLMTMHTLADCRFALSGALVVGLYHHGNVGVSSTVTQETLYKLPPPFDNATRIHTQPYGRLVMRLCPIGLCVWDLVERKSVWSAGQCRATGIGFSNDNELFGVYKHDTKTSQIWSTGTSRILLLAIFSKPVPKMHIVTKFLAGDGDNAILTRVLSMLVGLL